MRFFVIGHDNSARPTRRQSDLRSRRFLRFGNDFVVRPKRRQEISIEMLYKHSDAVMRAIAAGSLTLQSSTDVNVTKEELGEIFRKYSTATQLISAEGVGGSEPPTENSTETSTETADASTEPVEATTKPETAEDVVSDTNEVSEPPVASEELLAVVEEAVEPPVAESAPTEIQEEVVEVVEEISVEETPVKETTEELPPTRTGKKGRR